MPPHLDLRDLLATGRFFGLGKSSTRNDVYATLGPPDDVNTPRFDGKPPAICVYGGIELHFGRDPHDTLWLIHFDDPNLPPPGSSSQIVDPWVITAGAPLEQLRTACEDAGIPLSRHDTRPLVGRATRFAEMFLQKFQRLVV